MKPIPVAVDIARAADEVFEFIADFENNPRWQRGIQSSRWTSSPPHGPGATYDQLAHFLGKDIRSSFRVAEFEAGRRVKIVSTAGPFPISETRTVRPEGPSRCRVDVLVEGDAGGFFRIAAPLLRLMVQRSVTGDYNRLKRLLEGEPASGW
jgi:hypothetical protein